MNEYNFKGIWSETRIVHGAKTAELGKSSPVGLSIWNYWL